MDPQERRLQIRVYHEWLRIAADKPLPDLADMDEVSAERLGYDDWRDKSFVLQVAGVEVEANPQFAFIGDALLRDCEGCGPIAKLSDVPAMSLLSRLADNYLQCVANAAPVGFEASFINRAGQEVHYRGIILPLSQDGSLIDHVWGAVNFKVEAQSAEPQAAFDPLTAAPFPAIAGGEEVTVETMLSDVLPDDYAGQALAGAGLQLALSTASRGPAGQAAQIDPANVERCRAKLPSCIRIGGVIAAGVVDCATGKTLAAEQIVPVPDIERKTADTVALLAARHNALVRAGLSERIEDILVTLADHHLVLRPLAGAGARGIAFLLVLDARTAKPALARFKLADIVRTLTR